MSDMVDITPCGGSCEQCAHFLQGECIGCRKNGGRCVSMWENGCAIYDCCSKHDAFFCGICSEFPCDWLSKKISEWDKDGIARLQLLAIEYRKVKQHGKA